MTVTDTNLEKKLDTLVQAYQSVKKDSLANRHTKKAVEKRKLWLEQVDSLFDCASPNAEKAIKESRFLDKTDKKTDIGFLEDQRSARLQFLRNTDVIFEEKLKDKDEREEAVDKSVEKENKRVSEAAKNERVQIKEGLKREMEAGDNLQNESLDQDYESSENVKKSRRSDTVQIEFPKAPFDNPFMAATLDRLKITSNQAVGFFGALVKGGTMGGEVGDLGKFVVSRSSLERQRNVNREISATLAMEHFKKTKPKHSQLHWDGKLMHDSLGKEWEAESILLSGSPDWIEGKLLDVANLQNEEGRPSSSGEVQFEATKNTVLIWDVRDTLRSFCFDTTASNTGVYKGCCIRLSKWLGRPVLHHGCRHHIAELMAKASWYHLFEEDPGPDNRMMKGFRNFWPEVDSSPDAEILSLDQDLPGKQEAIDFYREILSTKNRKNVLPRDDYRYLITTPF